MKSSEFRSIDENFKRSTKYQCICKIKYQFNEGFICIPKCRQ